MTDQRLSWLKSSYSGGGGDNCVEVAMGQNAVHVRDSKERHRAALTLTLTAWSQFTAHLTTER
ncbi:DUF397 domain-containing protein [Streptomyces sp. XM4193]|uniref:DUF397 domain-containing protein n=1 Tax=Streptomyces sp. XM4193 TaxID=2929782 RepID=UPI001FFB8B85|nr:DUF397 domain-containing protein [Streptomyces sp. XM4193]MCK1796242.1 DUF397 domain-containing protein [Streptomyces sp. XM4193]